MLILESSDYCFKHFVERCHEEIYMPVGTDKTQDYKNYSVYGCRGICLKQILHIAKHE